MKFHYATALEALADALGEATAQVPGDKRISGRSSWFLICSQGNNGNQNFPRSDNYV